MKNFKPLAWEAWWLIYAVVAMVVAPAGGWTTTSSGNADAEEIPPMRHNAPNRAAEKHRPGIGPAITVAV